MNHRVPVLKSIKFFDSRMVEVVYNDYVNVTVKGVDEVFTLYDEVINDARVLKLLIIGKGTTITEEARKHIIRQNILRRKFIIAEAIVVNSLAQKLAANLYILFIAKIYPTQYFTSQEKAVKWLESHAESVEINEAIK